MRASERSLQFAGGTLGGQRHICAFFNSIDEEHRVLRSFIRDGLEGGENSFHIALRTSDAGKYFAKLP